MHGVCFAGSCRCRWNSRRFRVWSLHRCANRQNGLGAQLYNFLQNLAEEVQAAVNRPERLEDVARCVGWLRDAGVSSINLDLMYGLPRQTTANTLASLEQLLTLRPERLARPKRRGPPPNPRRPSATAGRLSERKDQVSW